MHGANAAMRRLHRMFFGLMFGLPGMINCREFEDFIIDYLEGFLPLHQNKIFERHLRGCSECQIYLKAYEAAKNLGIEAFEDPEAPVPPSVPDDLVAAILDARSS